MISDQELFELAKRGWIAGPEEKEEDFLARIASYPPQAHFSQADQKVKTLYGFCPDWIEVNYSNQDLSFWQGGCVFIEGSRLTLQLRSVYQKKASYLTYSKEEILAHEYVHAARMTFQEPVFEEVFAYRTASTQFRRYWGPFFRTTRESTLFVLVISVGFAAHFFEPFSAWTWSALSTVFGCGIFRLWKTHWQFKRCHKKLSALAGSKQKAMALMLFLTDEEIRFLPNASIQDYFFSKKETSIRQRQLWAIFCLD